MRLLITAILCALLLTVSAPAAAEYRVPPTGQTKSVTSGDGAVQAGGKLRYRDNGDGTVTDLSTGLVWEKKCDNCDRNTTLKLRHATRLDEAAAEAKANRRGMWAEAQ